MVDVVNNIELVKPKMIGQMRYNKGIFSLSEMIAVIGGPAAVQNSKLFVKYMDAFLGKLGIFLKSQEQTELCRYLGRTETNENLSLNKFVDLFKMEPPKKLITVVTEVFNLLKEANGTIPIEKFWASTDLTKHPAVTIYKRPKEWIKNKLVLTAKSVLNGKEDFSLEDLIRYYMDFIYLMPIENVNYYIKNIPELYGLPVNDI